MKNFRLLFTLILLFGILLFSCTSPMKRRVVTHETVLSNLADMVEQVVRQTSLSVNISGMAGNAVNIDKINNASICSSENIENVKKLQTAFNNHPNIQDNFGPFINTTTDKNGDVNKFPEMSSESCDYIYVSAQE